MPEGLYHVIHSDESFMLGDIRVNPFAIHDANEPTGYRLECRDKSVAVATDLGIYDAYTVVPSPESGCSSSGGKP